MKLRKKIIIAVDGHSSCGKSTVAKDIAKLLGYKYIDTGAMYRCVTLAALENNLISDTIDIEKLNDLLDTIDIKFVFNNEKMKSETYLNNRNVEDIIRGLEVSQNVSPISAIRQVREKMVKLQQNMSTDGEIVMDGRDIGTVVFPDADLKIFMTASAEVRAQRRYKELTEKGENVDYNDILKNVVERDQIDSTRKESPLRKADDAVELDNGNITRQEQLDFIMRLIDEKFGIHED